MSSPVQSTQLPLQANAHGSTSAFRENFLVSQIVTVVTAASLLLAGWLIFVFFAVGPTLGFRAEQTPQPQPVDEPKPTPNPTPVTTRSTTSQTQSINSVDSSQNDARQEQLALLHLQQFEFESRTTTLMTLVATVEQRLQKWQRRVESLPDSNEGRRLVSSAHEARFVLSQKTLEKTDLDHLRASVTKVRQTYAQAVTPFSDLKTDDDKLTAAEAELRSAAAKFDALETALDNLSPNAQPTSDGPTLRKAFAALDAEAAKSVRQAATEQEVKLQTRFAAEIKAAKEDLETLRSHADNAQSELTRIETESKQKLAEASKQRTDLLRELTQKRLDARKRMEEALPEFRERLSPFLKSSYRQPDGGGQFVGTLDSLPVSYSALLRVGALEDDQRGLGILYHLGQISRNIWGNDRLQGSFPDGVNWEFASQKPEIIRQLKAIQEFLRRHGEAMMEAKLLAP
ncbi:MAG: hypothetical protein IAG10_15585 [Planctomycetaceae bacterium]|nr:hypothetical protein [Planctomycetaceae bacterium]